MSFRIDYVIEDALNNPLNPLTYTVENADFQLLAPTNSQALFVGWYLDESFTVPFEVKAPYSDVTAYAKFASESEELVYEKINDAYYVSGYVGNEEIIIIPESYLTLPVIGILDNAFSGKEISKIVVPTSIKYISKDAFASCPSLQMSEYGGAKYIGTLENEFFALISACEQTPESIDISSECVLIADSALSLPTLKSVTGGDKVKFVGNSAFKSARALTEIHIFDTVVEIGENAFSSCRKLSVVELGCNLESLGSSTFSFCEALRVLKLPAISEIPERAFESCRSLETVIIELGVRSIGANAFLGIPESAAIYFTGSESEWGEIQLNGNFNMNEETISFNYIK